MELIDCPLGSAVRIVAVRLPDTCTRRLRELGLATGGTLHVTHRAAFGGRVVSVESDRFALDRDTVLGVEVEIVEEPAGIVRADPATAA